MRRLAGDAELVADELLRWRARLGRAVVARGVATQEEEGRLVARLGLGQDQLVVLRWDGSSEAAERLGTLNRTRDLLLANVSLVLIITDDDQGQREVLARAFDLLAHTDFVFGVGSAEEQEESVAMRGAEERRRGPVRILHLAGLQFTGTGSWSDLPHLELLTERLQRLDKKEQWPDIVAITGDVARTGAEIEFEQAGRWLRERLLPAMDLNAQRLLLVPGNHDVNRRFRNAGELSHGADVLSEHDPGMKNYRRFVERMGVQHASTLGWTLSLDIRGVRVLFLGSCLAWVSTNDHPLGGLIDLPSLADIGSQDSEADVIVMLAHHSSEHFEEWDRKTRGALRSVADLVLVGPRQRPQRTVLSIPYTQVPELSSGPLYPSRFDPPHQMSFNLVELRPAEGHARVGVWGLSRGRHYWMAYGENRSPDSTVIVPLGRLAYI